jgi:hypothetical protein
MTKVYKMSRDTYHEKWVETMGEWLSENEKNIEVKYFVLRFKNNTRATLNIGIWTVKEIVARLMIRLAWFYDYPYTLKAVRRRIDVLDDRIFYVSDYDIVEVLDYTVYRVLRKEEIKIESPDDVFRFLDDISKYFQRDEAQKDLNRIIENLKKYESYVEY